MTTTAIEMRQDIIGYVEKHQPVEIPLDIDTARELGRLAGHPVGSEPELDYVTAEVVQTLQGEGRITTVEKADTLLVECVTPLETTERKPSGTTPEEIFSPYDQVDADCIAIESIHAQLIAPEHLSEDREHELLHCLLNALDKTHGDLNKMM